MNADEIADRADSLAKELEQVKAEGQALWELNNRAARLSQEIAKVFNAIFELPYEERGALVGRLDRMARNIDHANPFMVIMSDIADLQKQVEDLDAKKKDRRW